MGGCIAELIKTKHVPSYEHELRNELPAQMFLYRHTSLRWLTFNNKVIVT